MAEPTNSDPSDTPDFRLYEALFADHAKELAPFPSDALIVTEEKKQLRALDRTLFVRRCLTHVW